MADSSHEPCPPDFFDIFAQLLAEVVEVEVDSTQPLLLWQGSRARGSRRSRRRPSGRGRRRRGRARGGHVVLKIGRVLELVFRPRHFQLDVARVVRVACGSVVVVTAGIDRDRLNALTSMATFFVPMPRNPPTPTTMPIILPVPSNSRSLTEADTCIVWTEHVASSELCKHPLVCAL